MFREFIKDTDGEEDETPSPPNNNKLRPSFKMDSMQYEGGSRDRQRGSMKKATKAVGVLNALKTPAPRTNLYTPHRRGQESGASPT